MGELFTLHRIDARKLVDVVPPETVDATITSPPYHDLKDYGFDSQIGFGQDYEKEYLRDLQTVFQGIFGVTKRTGSLWLIVDSFRRGGKLVPLPFHIAQRAEEEGWRLTNILIWDKMKTLPWSGKGQLRSIYEHILFFTKSSDYKFFTDRIREPTELKRWWVKYPERYNPRGKVPSDIWTFPIPTQGSWGNGFLRHFCPFPAELVERIISLTTEGDDVVLDPFAGSGVVLAQAHWMQRRYIGFELKEEYCRMFQEKVLREIGKEWRAREKIRETRERARKRLGDTIKKLRQLKFAFTLVKQVAEELGCELDDLDINTVFVISHRTNGQWPRNGLRLLTETVVLVMDDVAKDLGETRKVADRVLGKVPQWKYAVQADVQVLARRELYELRSRGHLFQNQHLWLYSASRFNWYDSEITFDSWMNQSTNKAWRKRVTSHTFPLVTNIKIRQLVEEYKEAQGYQTSLDSVEHPSLIVD